MVVPPLWVRAVNLENLYFGQFLAKTGIQIKRHWTVFQKNSEIGGIRSFTVSPNGLFFFFFLLFFIKKLFQNIDRSVLPKQNKMILFCTRNLRWSGDNKHPTRPHTILKNKKAKNGERSSKGVLKGEGAL